MSRKPPSATTRGPGLDTTLATLLSRRRDRNLLRQLTLPTAPAAIDFSSNNYLSLSTNPAIRASFLARLQHQDQDQDQQQARLGATGSRLLDGNSALAEALEARIAHFHRSAAGLLFNSAYEANVGLLACVPQPGDAVVYDELVHASVHDGMRLSRVGAERRKRFAHNDVAGLRQVLEGLLGPNETPYESGEGNVFVVVEGVYSMDGDVAPLREVVDCVEECLPRGNGYVIVDEAHSVGIIGERGRGLVCELGLEGKVWARVLGFGKAMGCAGGIVLCSEIARLYLINYARTLIYTTAMGFPSLVNIEVTYDFVMDGQAEPLLAHLHRLAREAHSVLLDICRRRRPPLELLRIDAAEPRSPIIPVFTSLPRSLAKYCQSKGIIVRPIVAPTVPKGKERIRVCLHAGNTIDEVKGLAGAVEAWVAMRMVGTIEQESCGRVDVDTALLALTSGRNEVKL
ncbi:putative 8-amino-7-oxononanoate synthase [Madurella mycetomatis]|uniref:8-amino-7-oxononanoate synthase n=1 Tax=Madurella mycetomatis TaxID=100816 RepID=A0A175W6R8_9PEZI|nr:putative 8-amino-7-oxononanoate synthase [Madurella mycetomatis]